MKRGRIEVIWNERAKPSTARACIGAAVMSRPLNTIVPASDASRPDI